MIKINNLAEINRAATLEASKALSKLTQSTVVVGTAHLEVKRVSELFQAVDPGDSVVSVETPLSADTKGTTMLLMPVETALGLADLLLKRDRGTSRAMTGEEEGVLKEVANIVIGNYLKVFANALPGTTTLLHGLSRISGGSYRTLTRGITSSLLPFEGEGLLVEVTFGLQHAVLKGYVILVFAGVEWKVEGRC